MDVLGAFGHILVVFIVLAIGRKEWREGAIVHRVRVVRHCVLLVGTFYIFRFSETEGRSGRRSNPKETEGRSGRRSNPNSNKNDFSYRCMRKMDFIHNLRVSYHVAMNKRVVDDKLNMGKVAKFYVDNDNVGFSVASQFKKMGYGTTVKYANEGKEHLWSSSTVQIEIKAPPPPQTSTM
jgi:hypothetical protein